MQDRFHKRKPNLWERSGGEQSEGLLMRPACHCDAARRIRTSRTDGGNGFGPSVLRPSYYISFGSDHVRQGAAGESGTSRNNPRLRVGLAVTCCLPNPACARVRTCVQPDLGQGHPGVQGSLLGGAALQRRRHLGQRLLYPTGSDGRGVDGA